MRKTQNRRTLQDVLQYIKAANRDGVLKESMMHIAGRTGYSNATIHRALQALDEQGVIRLAAPETQKDPTTIYYVGPASDDVTDLLQRSIYAMDELNRATQQVESVMTELRNTVSLLTNSASITVH